MRVMQILLISVLLVLSSHMSLANQIIDTMQSIARDHSGLGKHPQKANLSPQLGESEGDTSQAFAIVAFVKGSCPFCQRFAPILASYSKAHHVHVFAYSIDGQGLPEYPHPLTATPTITHLFFGQSQSITVPSTFLVNTHTLDAWSIETGFESGGQFDLDVERALKEARKNIRSGS